MKHNANGSFTIEWTGGGVLQSTTDIAKGPWTDVPGATTPYTFTSSEKALFARIKK